MNFKEYLKEAKDWNYKRKKVGEIANKNVVINRIKKYGNTDFLTYLSDIVENSYDEIVQIVNDVISSDEFKMWGWDKQKRVIYNKIAELPYVIKVGRAHKIAETIFGDKLLNLFLFK